jgi:hypothetical protein
MTCYQYECVYARNKYLRIMSFCDATHDDVIKLIELNVSHVYDMSRVEFEQYTDELHVFVRRRNNKRRDFVASFHAI